MIATITTIVAAFLFAAYIAVVFAVFGVPTSLSESHYLWTGRLPKIGRYIFPLFMCSFSGMLIPALLDKCATNVNFQFVVFLMLISLIFVGVSPWFKANDCGSRTHFAGAYSSALFGVAYCMIYGYWPIPVFFGIVAVGAVIRSRERYVLWLELAAFIAVIICMLIQ